MLDDRVADLQRRSVGPAKHRDRLRLEVERAQLRAAARQEGADRGAAIRQLDRLLKHVRERHRPPALQHLVDRAQRRRHAHGVAIDADCRHRLAPVHVSSCHVGSDLTAVDRVRPPVGKADEHRRAAAESGQVRVDDVQGELDRGGGVDRVTAGAQDVLADLRREPVIGRDDTIACVHVNVDRCRCLVVREVRLERDTSRDHHPQVVATGLPERGVEGDGRAAGGLDGDRLRLEQGRAVEQPGRCRRPSVACEFDDFRGERERLPTDDVAWCRDARHREIGPQQDERVPLDVVLVALLHVHEQVERPVTRQARDVDHGKTSRGR